MTLFLRFFLIISIFVLSSCTSMRFQDLFSGYAEQMKGMRIAQVQGDFNKALTLVPNQNESHNAYVLSLLEKGRLAFLQKNWLESQQYFAQAYHSIQADNEKAKIQISKGIQNISAVVSNDSAIKYLIPAYEQSMMHSYQALNYLNQGSLESALIEVRKANLVQETALRDNADKIYAAENEMASKGISYEKLYASYPSMIETVGDVKNGFQNAYTFYLSALLYEAAGEINDAYIDYKKALEIFPDNRYVRADVIRLAQQLNMVDDLALFSEDEIENSPALTTKNSGQLVILYEQNLVNEKQETKVNLPIFTRHDDMRFFSFSLPVYHSSGQISQPLYLHYQDNVYTSDEIVTLQSLASKQLNDQLPSLVTRQALRIVAKEQMRRKLSKEGGDVGNILASLYNIASEQADTRSWLSLPNRIHLLKVDLSEGDHQLELEHNNGRTLIDVTINSDRITLINLTSVGTYTGYKTSNL
mgnify:CR=1 FL=1